MEMWFQFIKKRPAKVAIRKMYVNFKLTVIALVVLIAGIAVNFVISWIGLLIILAGVSIFIIAMMDGNKK